MQIYDNVFQFTTSQGGRQHDFISNGKPIVFQFTTSQGGRLPKEYSRMALISFNSRPHKEVDRNNGNIADVYESFNSRPHKEVDFIASGGF